jgi:predicted PhzF superfamily epimerase YddE/YHI9
VAIPLHLVDAFADELFRENPAAVCLLGGPRDAAWMRAVAAEMNLSETAFVSPRADGAFDLRWFTPAVEVDLCGHATLASAHTPASGIAEDAVTGSAHCCLGPFWSARLGKTRLLAHQASKRGGVIRVELAPGGRVHLGGRAVTVLRGELADG